MWGGIIIKQRKIGFVTSKNVFRIQFELLIDYNGRNYFNLGANSPEDIILHRGEITFKLKENYIFYKFNDRSFLLSKNYDYDFSHDITTAHNKTRIRAVFASNGHAIPVHFNRNGRYFQILRLFHIIL